MIELSRSRPANGLAVVAMLGMLGALLLVGRAVTRMAGTAGPSVLASSDEAVYFVAGDALHVADTAGRLQEVIPLAALGLGRTVSHIAAMEEFLLVADGGTGIVKRCDLVRRTCTKLTALPGARRGEALALAPAPEAGRLYVADTANHALHAYGLDGRRLYRLDIEGGLKYPNEVLWLGRDQLLVVDTNHHRILIVQDEGTGRTRLLQEMAAKNSLGRGNTWPTAAARDSTGRTWVINSDGRLRNGEVIAYDAAGAARRRVELGENADPIALATLDGGVLLADFENDRLQRIDVDSGRVEVFGDAALQGALNDLGARRATGQQAQYLSIGLMVVFGLIGAVAGYLDWKARREYSAVRPPGVAIRQGAFQDPAAVCEASARFSLRPDAHGIVWLHATSKHLRALYAITLLVALSFILMVATLVQSFSPLPLKLIAGLAAMGLLVLGLNAWIVLGMKRLRIGTDGKTLHVVDMFGRRARGLPETFVHTGRHLLLGRVAVPVPNPRGSMFDKEAFAALIDPLLERTPRSNEMTVLWRRLRTGDPLAWLSVAAVIALLGLQIWFDP